MSIKSIKRFIRRNLLSERTAEKIRKMRYVTALHLGRTFAFAPGKVVFSSFSGRSYSDNPRCISEMLHKMCPKAEIVWLIGKPDEWRSKVPDYVRLVPRYSPKAAFELGSARVWVDNFTQLNYLRPKKGKQFYMQTWHGDRAFKKIGYDNDVQEKYRLEYRIEEECDVFLSGSDFGEKMFGTAFRYHGPFLKNGAPRNDILVRNDPAEIAAVKAKLGIDPAIKLLLYAPTYRETTTVIPKEAQMDLLRTLQHLEKTTGDKWMCLYRAHYLSTGIDLDSVQDRLIDMTRHDDMSELLLIADILLTDYSSSAMDYCVMDRPVLLFQSDIEDYLAHREMYFDMKDTPFFVAMDQGELERLITDMTPGKAAENCRAIRDYFGICENGRATEEACKYIIDKLTLK